MPVQPLRLFARTYALDAASRDEAVKTARKMSSDLLPALRAFGENNEVATIAEANWNASLPGIHGYRLEVATTFGQDMRAGASGKMEPFFSWSVELRLRNKAIETQVGLLDGAPLLGFLLGALAGAVAYLVILKYCLESRGMGPAFKFMFPAGAFFGWLGWLAGRVARGTADTLMERLMRRSKGHAEAMEGWDRTTQWVQRTFKGHRALGEK